MRQVRDVTGERRHLQLDISRGKGEGRVGSEHLTYLGATPLLIQDLMFDALIGGY